MVLDLVSHQTRVPSLVTLKISITRQKYTRSSRKIRERSMQPYARNASRNMEMVEAEIAVILLSLIS